MRATRLVGHYAPWLLAAVVGLLIAATLVPRRLLPFHPRLLLLSMLLLLPVAVYLGVSILAHNRHLCEPCIRSVPLDASTVASRNRLRFTVAHLFERKAYAFGYLGLVVGSSFLYAHPVGRYAWAAVQASLVYLLLVYVTHQRLRPWCPYCRTGGQEITAPTGPLPVSTGV